MIINSGITVVITVLDLGVLQISPTTRILVPRIKKVVVGGGFRFRILTILLVHVVLLEEFNPSR